MNKNTAEDNDSVAAELNQNIVETSNVNKNLIGIRENNSRGNNFVKLTVTNATNHIDRNVLNILNEHVQPR